MKFSNLKFLLKVMVILIILFVAINTFESIKVAKETHPTKIVQSKEEIEESQYIVSEKMILSKLQSKAQLVSIQQEFEKTYTDVDKQWNGDRHTTLHIKGSYKMGLDTSEIEVRRIDEERGVLYIKLGVPKLISLELPYDQIEFDKKKGLFRAKMNDEEMKNFYKAVEDDIRNEILSDKEVMKQANLYNQEAVKSMYKELGGTKHIIFE